MLRVEGVKKIHLLGNGDNAIILEDYRGLVFRLRGPETDDLVTKNPPDIPQIIKPIKQIDISGIRVVILPKVTTLEEAMASGRLSDAQAEDLIMALRIGALQNDSTALFWDWRRGNDIKFSQVGLLDDGTPIIIDMGSVAYVDCLLEYVRDLARYDQFVNEIEELKTVIFPSFRPQVWDGSWHSQDGRNKTELLSLQEGEKLNQRPCCDKKQHFLRVFRP